MHTSEKMPKVNRALLYRNETIQWINSVIQENKPLVQIEQELKELFNKMGYVLIHTLVSRLSDENTKVRNISSWCLRYLRDPRSVRPFAASDSKHPDKGLCKGCCSGRTSGIGG